MPGYAVIISHKVFVYCVLQARGLILSRPKRKKVQAGQTLRKAVLTATELEKMTDSTSTYTSAGKA